MVVICDNINPCYNLDKCYGTLALIKHFKLICKNTKLFILFSLIYSKLSWFLIQPLVVLISYAYYLSSELMHC